MNSRSFTQILSAILVLLCFSIPSAVAQNGAEVFMGRWGLHLPGGAGWLHVHDDNGYLDAELLWYGGSVLPVANVYVSDGKLVVTRVANVKRSDDRTHQTREEVHSVHNLDRHK